ncbi:MAG: HEPN domain-containing protein [Bacteroidota bacterium]|nr:HEPN domain-containing protein [Bacteroidota bacterium]
MHADASPWIEKAEGDYEGAIYLSKKKSKRIAHIICFSCQQAAEKYLKAYLVEKDIRFSKTHFLKRELLPLCEKVDSEFKVLTSYLEALDPYSVEFRYPGEEISGDDVRIAVVAVKKVRKFIRGKLGLEKQRRLL